MSESLSTISRDLEEEDSRRKEERRGSQRFDAPGVSFSTMSGGEETSQAFEASLLGNSDISRIAQLDPRSDCSPFCSATPEMNRRRTIARETMDDSVEKKASTETASRRNTFGNTATNIFNFLYSQEVGNYLIPEEDEQSGSRSSNSLLGRSVGSDTNTKSTFGDTTITGGDSTTVSGVAETSNADSNAKFVESTAQTTDGMGSLARSYVTSRTNKTIATNMTTKTNDTIQTFSPRTETSNKTKYTDDTTQTVFSPPPAYDPVQQALDDLASTPLPRKVRSRLMKSALKSQGITNDEIVNDLNQLEVINDDMSEKAIVSQHGGMDPCIEVERQNSTLAPPVLHRFCLTVTKAADLQTAEALVTTAAAAEVDAIGRLAMHCLSDNMALAEAVAYPEELEEWPSPEKKPNWNVASPMSQASHTTRRRSNRGSSISRSTQGPDQRAEQDLEDAATSFVVNGLLKAYPAAMISQDGNGQIPFESVLFDWVEQNLEVPYEDVSTPKRKFSAEQFSSMTALWQRTTSLWTNNSQQDFSSNGQQFVSKSRSIQSSGSQDVEGGKLKNNSSLQDTVNETDHYFPSNVKLSAQVYFAVRLLSAIIDALDNGLSRSVDPSPVFTSPTTSLFQTHGNKDSSLKRLKDTTSADLRSEIVHSVASIPGLLKVILLMEDENQQDFLMSTKLIRSAVAHQASVGPWLTHMLQSGERRVVDRALAYIELVSSDKFWVELIPLSQKDLQSKNSKQRDILLEKMRAELYDRVSQLPNFVPSLLSLGGRSIEEASTTKLVRRVLDRIIARPFCATFIFCDALFLAIMIVGFRMAVHRVIMNEAPGNILRYIYVANMGIFYFVIRELGKAVSLSMMNRHARLYFLSFWNATDLLATFLALASTVAIRSQFHYDESEIADGNVPHSLRYLLTLTTGILWLRVLSFLKGINMQLATFVLAILQISRDIICFCVILLTLLIAFSQMFFTLMAPGTCGVVPEEPSCRQSEYYLRMYSMLIFQEFDRESYDSYVSVVLVVLYSFMVVLVLLNVLIAVASDSYEKCLVRSQNLFGRARVMLISEMVSFQNLLRRSSGEVSALEIYKAWWSKDSAAGWSRGSLIFFGLSSVVVIVWAIAETSGYFTGPGYGNVMMSLGSILVTVILFVCIMFFLSVGAGNESSIFERNGKKMRSRFHVYARRFESLLHNLVLRLLGSSVNQGTIGVSEEFATTDEEWSGRIHYLKKEMNRIADEQRALSKEHIQNLEISLREEVAKLESSFDLLKQEVSKPSAVAPEDIPSMLGVAIEALQKVQKTIR